MIRLENSQPVSPAAKLEAATSAQRFELHAKSSISGTEPRGCLATVWQGIKNVFNFLFGWIFRCCGAEKAQEKTFEPTAEFQTFFDDYMQAYYPHLDMEYFKDFDTRKDLYKRALRGDFDPVQESKVRALAQWLKDEQGLFVTSDEEKEAFPMHLKKRCERFLKGPVDEESADNLLNKLLTAPLNEGVLSDEEINIRSNSLEKWVSAHPGVHIQAYTEAWDDLFAQAISASEGILYTSQDIAEEIAQAIENNDESIREIISFDSETSSSVAASYRKREKLDENYLNAICAFKKISFKVIYVENLKFNVYEAPKEDAKYYVAFFDTKGDKMQKSLLTFDSEEALEEFKKVTADDLNREETK